MKAKRYTVELTKKQVDALLHAIDVCKNDYDDDIKGNCLSKSGFTFIRRLHEAENKIVKALRHEKGSE